jgi:hypothetical protein
MITIMIIMIMIVLSGTGAIVYLGASEVPPECALDAGLLGNG